MTTTQTAESPVGRGSREGARLFRAWFESLTGAAERGEHSAYVFVMGSFTEILRAFDFNIVFPEIHSLQTAIRREAEPLISEAEGYGYSPDVCAYVKADVALQLRGGTHPLGQLPKPSLAVYTNACNTYIKWAEIWERMYGTPLYTLDVPGTRSAGKQTWPGDASFANDHGYVRAQIAELIALCEEVTGRRFDIDRLRETMAHANVVLRSWRRVLELNRSTPAVFNALTDGTVYLGVANAMRGTPEGAQYFTELVEELEYRAVHGIGTVHDEHYRLAFVGVPCYPIFRRFNELFTDWGGAFVTSTYLWFASGGGALGFEYDLDDPLESLAEGVLVGVRHAMDAMFHQDTALLDMVDPYGLDGIVFHPIKSCRTVSTGLADSRRAILAQRDIATLFIESDHMDKRNVSEAQMKNRIDAFFEGLATRRRHAVRV
jgi:benzoyl-CoA reductase subunit B